jgi:hypothetical protein
MGGDVGDVGASIAASKNAVENNLQNKDPWWTEKDKKEAEERLQQGFVNKYCGGVNDAACSQKLQEKNNETLKILGNLVLDFTPVVSDVKAFDEAETAEDYIIATIGILPPAKLIKLAKKASKASDVTLAKKLIKEAEDLASSAKNKPLDKKALEAERGAGKGSSNENKSLNVSEQRAVRSLEEQIRLHEKKLAEYKRDPYSFDNKGHLKNAPNEEIRQKIINARIKHLEHEINTFKNNINKIKNKG